jgi:hypothetical protein
MGLSELVTYKDPYYLHKISGVYVLCNFFYQFYLYYSYGIMDLNIFNMFPHFTLHLTSFIFRVMSSRVFSEGTTMFIWEEFRLHSMIFAYRSCLSILIPNYRGCFIFLTMFFADAATFLLGNDNITNVRGNHNKVCSGYYENFNSVFYSTSQFSATLICGGFFQENYSSILTFTTLPVIQTSAFGMTLIKENIINQSIWNIVYNVELLLVYYMWYLEQKNILIIPMSMLCYILRKCGMNKYYLFLIITFSDYLWRNFHIYNGIEYD